MARLGHTRGWNYVPPKPTPQRSPKRRLPKLKAPRLSRKSLPSFRVPRLPIRVLLLALLAAVLVTFGLLLFNSSVFEVKTIKVRGEETLNAGAVVELSEARGENIFSLHTSEVERRLEENPYIADAMVRRAWPDGLTITIQERKAVAVWMVGVQGFLVDAKGFVIGPISGLPPAGTIQVISLDGGLPEPGQRVDADALALVTGLMTAIPASTGELIASFEYSQSLGLTAITASGLHLVFGNSNDYEYKLESLAGTISGARAQGLAFSLIDLRFGESPALR